MEKGQLGSFSVMFKSRAFAYHFTPNHGVNLGLVNKKLLKKTDACNIDEFGETVANS